MPSYFRRLACLVSLIALLFGLAHVSTPVVALGQTIRYAQEDGLSTGQCNSWANACTLRYALLVSVSGDQIWVMEGVHTPTTDTDRAKSFVIPDGVEVYGGFEGTETALSQRSPAKNITFLSGDIGISPDFHFDNSYHVVAFLPPATSSVLDGFTIKYGKADGSGLHQYGAGIYIYEGSPTIANSILLGNVAGAVAPETPVSGYGGGVYVYNGSPTLSNVKFNYNQAADHGGGLYMTGGGMSSLQNVEFSSNIAGGDGGGLAIGSGQVIITQAIFQNNTAVGGGGMFNASGIAGLTGVTFLNNVADSQGGGYKSTASASATMTSVTFSGNISNSDGGGMYIWQSSVVMTDARFLSNIAGNEGGGMRVEAGPVNLTGGLFFGNQAGNGGAIYNKSTGSFYLKNVTLSGNEASSGGGMYNYNSTPSLANTTVTGNAAFYGGGIHNINSNPQITDTIFWNNLLLDENSLGPEIYNADEISIPLFSSSIIKGSGGSAAWNLALGADFGGNLDADPLLAPLADNKGPSQTHALGAGSPAIDSGDLNTCTSADQRGIPRAISDGNTDGLARCDRGAFEVAIFTARSNAGQDGWLLELGENSNQGGILDSSAATLRLGDDSARKQYRGLLSFSTASLPNNAVITKVSLRVKQQGITGGGNPVSIFQGFFADVRNGSFGTAALLAADWQASASKTVGPLSPTPGAGWYTLNLTNARDSVNKLAGNAGLTQIRLRFKLDDNNNNVANFLSLYSGDAPAANRPQLIVEFYLP